MPDLPAPRWLVRAGVVSWLALGVVGLAAVVVVGLSVFQSILLPVLFAAIAAAVFVPLVDQLEFARVPRSVGALVTIVLIVGLAVGVVALITRAVIVQREPLGAAFGDAFADLQAALSRMGLDAGLLESQRESLASVLRSGGSGLLTSAASAAGSAVTIAIGLFLALVFLYFLLRDGRQLPHWAARNLGPTRARALVDVGRSGVVVIRRYFTGRAIVAAFDAVAIGIGAGVLDVPLVPAIVMLTFLGGFVPYIGAVSAGALAVVLAVASGGLGAAVAMLVVVLVVQNVLEPLVEARALGHSLGLHPMVVIVATTMGGIAAGIPGLVLGAPVTATVVRVREDYRRALAEREADPGTGAPDLG